tara:strand:+ start:400 stop:585 length:186 start_codon:yes stop_codon:yes gene_type:complete
MIGVLRYLMRDTFNLVDFLVFFAVLRMMPEGFLLPPLVWLVTSVLLNAIIAVIIRRSEERQ